MPPFGAQVVPLRRGLPKAPVLPSCPAPFLLARIIRRLLVQLAPKTSPKLARQPHLRSDWWTFSFLEPATAVLRASCLGTAAMLVPCPPTRQVDLPPQQTVT